MMSKTDVTESVLSLEVFHGGAKFIDANHNPLWNIPTNINMRDSLSLFPPSGVCGKCSKNVLTMGHVKLPGVGLEPGNKLRLFA